jgi:hypothetical protein
MGKLQISFSLQTSIVDPDPHQIDKLYPDPHQIDKLYPDPHKPADDKPNFFKVLSLYLQVRGRIRIRNKVNGTTWIRIRIKLTSRIRIRINVMRIRNTAKKIFHFCIRNEKFFCLSVALRNLP